MDPEWAGSDQGVSCTGGIGFSFAGITYTASDGRCPSQVEYFPGHFESDAATYKWCTYWFAKGTYTTTITKYSCHGPFAGCGLLGFGYCCEEDSSEDGATFDNFTEALCKPCGQQQ